jgi:hypothetical protein
MISASFVYLSQLSASKKYQTLSDSEIKRTTNALTTNEHQRPDRRAAVRLDWAALARRLDARLRKMLHWLAIGERKVVIAKRLHVSPCRITQLLAMLAREIAAFFGEDLPSWCVA